MDNMDASFMVRTLEFAWQSYIRAAAQLLIHCFDDAAGVMLLGIPMVLRPGEMFLPPR